MYYTNAWIGQKVNIWEINTSYHAQRKKVRIMRWLAEMCLTRWVDELDVSAALKHPNLPLVVHCERTLDSPTVSCVRTLTCQIWSFESATRYWSPWAHSPFFISTSSREVRGQTFTAAALVRAGVGSAAASSKEWPKTWTFTSCSDEPHREQQENRQQDQ